MKSVLEQRLEKIITPVLGDHKAALVALEYKGGILTVMVEGSDGSRLGVDDFANISRDLSPALEVEDPIQGAYRLEISSPGIDRPLVKLEDYVRFSGFEAKIELNTPIEGQKRFRGRILGQTGGIIQIKTDTGDKDLPFDDVAKAKLILTDELINATKDMAKKETEISS